MKAMLLWVGLVTAPSFAQGPPRGEGEHSTNGERRYVCVALSSDRGNYLNYHGYSRHRHAAARKALRYCRAYSFAPRTCRIQFCEAIASYRSRGNPRFESGFGPGE